MTCKGCGNPVAPRRSWCSLQCFAASRRVYPWHRCVGCGKTFRRRRGISERPRYCSNDCRYTHWHLLAEERKEQQKAKRRARLAAIAARRNRPDPRLNTAEDFWRLVGEPNARGCREWLGRSRSPIRGGAGGYGLMNFHGRRWFASRLAWFLTHGPIPPGLLVCHKCDNPPCCNPEHLFLGTHLDNALDRDTKGRSRHAYGSYVANAKLVDLSVALIRWRAICGEGQESIAKSFGVTQSLVSKIRRGHIWQHVQPAF